jgi:hypothetical protein
MTKKIQGDPWIFCYWLNVILKSGQRESAGSIFIPKKLSISAIIICLSVLGLLPDMLCIGALACHFQ